MPTYKRPGTYVNEFLTPNNTVQAGSTTVAAFLGSHFRGPTDEPVLVNSWGEFVSSFGGFAPTGQANSELPYALYNYFANGGRQAYVCRVIGTGSSVASVTLQDRAGTPLDTLKVDALNAGAWGSNIRIDIVDRNAATGRFDLIVYYGGTTSQYQVERWTDLTMDDTDDRFVESIINSPVSGSTYIRVTDMDSATAAYDDMPSAQTGTALSGGADGSDPTQSEKTDAVTETTTLLDQIEGLCNVAYPGETASAVLGALVSYCEDRGTFFAVLDTDSGITPSTAVTDAGSLPASSHAAVYYPWLTTTDPASNSPGATRLCPPSAFAAGKMAEVDTLRGVWKAPAGLEVRLSGVVSVERTFTSSELDTLNEGHVNAIRSFPGAGAVIFGARTLNTNRASKYINVRRTLNYIKDSLTQSTEFAVFEVNDQTLWNSLASVASRFLGALHAQGGLRGTRPEEAFYVKCDGELNTPQVIESGQVLLEVGVALQFPAEFVVIRIGQWEGGQSTATEG